MENNLFSNHELKKKIKINTSTRINLINSIILKSFSEHKLNKKNLIPSKKASNKTEFSKTIKPKNIKQENQNTTFLTKVNNSKTKSMNTSIYSAQKNSSYPSTILMSKSKERNENTLNNTQLKADKRNMLSIKVIDFQESFNDNQKLPDINSRLKNKVIFVYLDRLMKKKNKYNAFENKTLSSILFTNSTYDA
jgi:hypothetical protein